MPYSPNIRLKVMRSSSPDCSLMYSTKDRSVAIGSALDCRFNLVMPVHGRMARNKTRAVESPALKESSEPWRFVRGHNDKNPKAEHGEEIDREYDTPEPDVAGKDLDAAMNGPAGEEDRGGGAGG